MFYNDSVFRVIGLDISVDNMGFSVIDYDVDQKAPTLVFSTTYLGKHLMKRHLDVIDNYGERTAKLHGHYVNFLEAFRYWQPHVIAYEHPFMGRFPAAYGALMQCVSTIQQASIAYDVNVPLVGVDPPTVKMAVGTPPKSKDKDLVGNAVREIFTPMSTGIDFEQMSEHASDSVAVAYWALKECFFVEVSV